MPFTMAQSHPKEKWEKKKLKTYGFGECAPQKECHSSPTHHFIHVCQESSSEIFLLICVKENSFCDSE